MKMDVQSLSEIDNMVFLNDLNEAALLHNLRKRFTSSDGIYTNVGAILVVAVHNH
jgi:myosin heavy subunit